MKKLRQKAKQDIEKETDEFENKMMKQNEIDGKPEVPNQAVHRIEETDHRLEIENEGANFKKLTNPEPEDENNNFIDEDDESFIGPKLPKLMSKAEKEAFIQEELAFWRS